MKYLLAALLAVASTGGLAAESYGFSVEVSFSPQAAARLSALHEGVSGAAYYYGVPTRAARKRADDVGQIDLDAETVTVENTAHTLTFPGKVVKRSALAWLVKREVRVNVNVFSARRSGPDNFLDCGIYDGPVSIAAARTPKIACKLIGE